MIEVDWDMDLRVLFNPLYTQHLASLFMDPKSLYKLNNNSGNFLNTYRDTLDAVLGWVKKTLADIHLFSKYCAY